MEIGDTVIYCDGRNEHEAIVTGITNEETVSLSYKVKGRDVLAQHIPTTPGLTGVCWKTIKEHEKAKKTKENEAKKAQAETKKKVESIDTTPAKDDDNATADASNGAGNADA